MVGISTTNEKDNQAKATLVPFYRPDKNALCGLAAEIFNGAKGDQFTGLTLDKVRLLTELEDRTLALY